MRSRNELIDSLILILPLYESIDYCICDVLNLHHKLKFVSFNEMQLLQKLINEKIELSLMDEIIEFSNYELFTQKLNALKD